MPSKIFAIKALFVLILTFIFAASSAAQSSLGLTPAVVDATVKSGKTYTQTFTIANNTNVRLRFRCFSGDFWYGENNERIIERAGTQPRSASSWVQFSPAEFIVEPNGSNTVNLIVTIPENVNGGFYTIPFFEGEPANISADADKDGTAGASFAVRLGGLLMLATEKTSEYNVEVRSSKIDPPTASAPLEMHFDLHNRSTAHAMVTGKFAILSAEGKVAGRGKIEETRFLPGQRNTVTSAWAGQLAPGKYTAIVTFTYNRAGLDPASLVSEVPFEVQ